MQEEIMATVRLTMSQALTRWMTAQSIEQLDGSIEPAFAGVWAIFGHGNVAGLGEASLATISVGTGSDPAHIPAAGRSSATEVAGSVANWLA